MEGLGWGAARGEEEAAQSQFSSGGCKTGAQSGQRRLESWKGEEGAHLFGLRGELMGGCGWERGRRREAGGRMLSDEGRSLVGCIRLVGTRGCFRSSDRRRGEARCARGGCVEAKSWLGASGRCEMVVEREGRTEGFGKRNVGASPGALGQRGPRSEARGEIGRRGRLQRGDWPNREPKRPGTRRRDAFQSLRMDLMRSSSGSGRDL